MKRQNTIDIITVNFRSKSNLLELFDSLQIQSFKDFGVFVVNADKTEDLSAIVSDKSFDFEIKIEDISNKGFAYANNIGIKKSESEYLLLINPDIICEPDFLQNLIDGIKNTDADIVGPKILSQHDNSVIDRIYDGYSFSGRALTIGTGERDDGQYDRERKVFALSYAAVLAKRSFFEEVGPLNESFFMYYEDVEMGLRAQSFGKKSYYIPNAVCYHEGSGSSGGKYSNLQVEYTLRNTIWLFWKVLTWKVIVKNFFYHLWWMFVLTAFLTLKGKGISAFRGILRSVIDTQNDPIKRISDWPLEAEYLRRQSVRDVKLSRKNRRLQFRGAS
jgi:GT2 family glycosyltransferase